MSQRSRSARKPLGQCPAAAGGRSLQRGFILLIWTMGLFTLSLLLLTGLEQRRGRGLQTQRQQQAYLQALTQSLSALEIAPYLTWQPANRHWQCQRVEGRQLCLRERMADPEMALLRTTPLKPLLVDTVTLYRFVKQPAVRTTDRHSEPIQQPPVNLLWVAGGWLDSCPEKEAILCQ